MDPGFHCVRTRWIQDFSASGPLPDASRAHWIRGFMEFRSARRTRTVLLMVLA